MKWLRAGAQPSETCRSILRRQGILRRFHEEKLAARQARAPKKEPEPAVKPAAAEPAEPAPESADENPAESAGSETPQSTGG
jgi:small subunit ribosomal protein S16